ncbi:MAG: 3-hydroxybutyrate dehydrogenase [Kiloniellales bacterium]
MQLEGKVALVTGSTSGIGRGIAEALAAQGATLTLNGFGEAGEIAALCAALAERSGAAVRYSPADMSKPDQVRAMVDESLAAFGRLDILVNNAGIQHVAPLEDFAPERWDAVIAIDLSAAFHAISRALPAMRREGWGRIVNVASAHGLVASVEKAAYVAAKHGLVGLTKVVALETAGSGITCNAICPGWVLTSIVRAQIETRAKEGNKSFDEAKVDLLGEKQPSLEFVTPEQLGQLALFLCGDGAAQMTGAALAMDGGWTAQ